MCRVNPVKHDDGIIITNVTEIRKEWNRYYQKLYTEPRENDQDDFAKDITYLSNVLGGPPISIESTGGPITVKDTVKQIYNMKVKKASRWEISLSVEHLKHCGTTTLASITWLMNEMI